MRTTLLLLILAACTAKEKPATGAPIPAPSPLGGPSPEPEPAASESASDTLETSAGEVVFRPIQHATLVMTHGGRTWVFDPTIDAPLDGVQADVVLVTDIHPDHLDPAGIDRVRKEGTVVVGPAAAGDKTKLDVVIANGESKDVGGARVTAVPMYNLERGPEPGKLYHEKGRGNGYIIEIGDGRIYVAGDTECTDEIEALTDIDVAFLPMNLPYTMAPEEALSCVRAFQPGVLYPYHYGESDLSGLASQLVGSTVEYRQREWYPKPEAPQTAAP